jgi:Ca2+-binding RTX toxin-like protein
VVTVSGLPETATIAHAESALDQLTIAGGAGDDVIDASNLAAHQIGLVLNGGAGNDIIFGSHGNDSVNGGTGNDVAALGDGNDIFTWNPGDGSDIVDGQGGFDTLVFHGSNAGENISISANGNQATLFRDVADITMHLTSVERIELSTLGGADNVAVNDLTGSGVKQVAIDLGLQGAGDGQSDNVTVNGTAGNDHIDLTASGTVVTVSGLSAQVTIDHGEAGDHLTIDAGAGNDTIDASKMPAGTLALTLNGGDGNDTIRAASNEFLAGGNGNDTFVFKFGASGHDVVQDFQVHGTSPQGDVVRLQGFADHTLDQALADGHIAQSGADVVISDGTTVVATLQNVALASLHAHDFMFA